MAGLRPPLPLRRLHGPAQPAEPVGEGVGAPGTDRVMVTTPLTNTVRTTSTIQRDVTHPKGPPWVLRHGGRPPPPPPPPTAPPPRPCRPPPPGVVRSPPPRG